MQEDDLYNCNSAYNIELYTFYATFKTEDSLREAMRIMPQDKKDYYFPTFDHYLDAINFANGDYRGSSYIPDNIMDIIDNMQQVNATTLTNALLAQVMQK